ncbi:MAG: VWA domain-containing protein [Mariprofundus sp.]
MESLSLDSISLEFAWALLLLPLPLLVRMLLSPVAQSGNVAWVPFADELASGTVSAAESSSKSRLIFATLIWLLLLLAAARPEWHGDAVELPVSGRDLLMAVDISGSMQTKDFVISGQQTDRLTATKAVANAFIERREGDRVGLILFGTKAYVQTPLTFDRDTVSILLNEAVIGLAGEETAIGDAIGLAVKRLEQGESASTADQVLVLLTDGVNTAGMVSPEQAAELAVQAGLTIYTIGIGADAMLVRSFFGNRQVNPSAQLDEKTLTQIAEQTGGRYFRARDTEALQHIYQMIDQLEPVEKETEMFRPRHALFMWPLGLALLLSVVLALSMTPALSFMQRKGRN